MSGSEVILEVGNLSKVYDREVLMLEKLSFEQGKIYGIIGPSGAGKSTFLRLVNLLEAPTTGNIYFRGQKVALNGKANLELRREMTMVFQKPLLFNCSVQENIAYGLKARRYPRGKIRARVEELLKKVGLQGMAHRHATTLSGGEAQRVALARAVAFEPALLLLDEATANLDPPNVELMERLILDLNQETGMTFLMVTHNIFQARRIAHEVAFLYAGRLVERGKTEKIFTSPQDQRTRDFLEGRMVY